MGIHSHAHVSRILSIALTLSMCFSLVPSAAWAEAIDEAQDAIAAQAVEADAVRGPAEEEPAKKAAEGEAEKKAAEEEATKKAAEEAAAKKAPEEEPARKAADAEEAARPEAEAKIQEQSEPAAQVEAQPQAQEKPAGQDQTSGTSQEAPAAKVSATAATPKAAPKAAPAANEEQERTLTTETTETGGDFGDELTVTFKATAAQGQDANIFFVKQDATRAKAVELAEPDDEGTVTVKDKDGSDLVLHVTDDGFWFELDSTEAEATVSFDLTYTSEDEKGAESLENDAMELSLGTGATEDEAKEAVDSADDPTEKLSWQEAAWESGITAEPTDKSLGYFDDELSVTFTAKAGRGSNDNTFYVKNSPERNRALCELLKDKSEGDTVTLDGVTDRLGNPVEITVTSDGFYFTLDNSEANNSVTFDLAYAADPQGTSNPAKMSVFAGVGSDDKTAAAALPAKADVTLNWSDSSDKLHYTINLIWDTSIEEDKIDQNVVTTKQTLLQPKYKLDLQTSSVNYEAGEFKMELPYALWAYRGFGEDAGSKAGTSCPIPVDISIPEKGKGSSNVKFQYEIVYDESAPKDLTKAKLVITNSQYLPAGTNATITVKYSVDPWLTVDLSKAEITVNATAQATNQTAPETGTSNTITYRLDTGFDKAFLRKTSTWTSTEAAAVYQKPDNLPADKWDPESWNMVRYHFNYGVSDCNQPIDYSFLAGLPEGAELVMVIPHVGGSRPISIDADACTWERDCTKKSVSSSDGDYWFYVRYPRTGDGSVTYHTELDMTATVSDPDSHLESDNDFNDVKQAHLEWDFEWVDYEFKPTGTESYSKFGWGDDYIETIKSNNTDVEFNWRMYVTTLRWYMEKGETQQIVATDDAHFWKYVPKTYDVNKYRNVSDMHWMDGDTYEFSRITSISLQHYDLSHVDGSRSYPDFPGGTLTIQGSRDGKTWDTLKEIEVPAKTDRTSPGIAIPDSGKYEFAKGSGYTRLRVISPEVGRGSLNIEVNFYTRMKAQSKLVQQWLEECEEDQQVYVRNYAAYQHLLRDAKGNVTWDDQLSGAYSFAARDGASDGQTLAARDVAEDQYWDGTQSGYVRRAYANGKLQHFGHNSQIQKKTGTTVNDTANHRAIVPFGIFEEEIISGKMGDQYTNIYKDFSQDSGVFYDLLPPGYHYLEGSMESLTVKAQDANARVEVIDNYKGTGREMLVVHVSKPADPASYTIASDTNLFTQGSQSYRADYYLFNKNEETRYHSNYGGNPHTGFRIDFKAYIAWKDLKDHSQEVNLVAFQRTDGEPIGVYKSNSNTTADDKGYPDRQPSFPSSDSQVIKEFKKATVPGKSVAADGNAAYAFYDVDGDGAISPKSTMYAYSNANPQVTSYVETGIEKDIIGDEGYAELGSTYAHANDQDGWNKLDRTTLTGSYQYRVTTKVYAAEMRDLIVYDTLEDAKNKEGAKGEVTWQGTFDSVDVSEAEKLGFAPVVYYSTKKGLDYNSISGREKNVWIEDSSVWSTECPADKAAVTAIAVDLRKMADGSDAVMLSRDPNYDDKGIDAVSFVINMTAPERYPSDPAMIYAINRPAYTCYQQAWFSAEGADFNDIGLRVKILLPVEVKVKKTTINGNTPDDAAFTLTMPNGYEYDFTFADFDKKGEFTFNQQVLDVAPSKDAKGTAKPDFCPVGEYRIEEKASTAANEGKYLSVIYDEGTNGAINVAGKTTAESVMNVTNFYNEKIDVPVRKVWDDADDQDGIRPSSVTVKLLADGKDTGKTLELTADGKWEGSFEGLWKYNEKTFEEIAYTVAEASVPAGYMLVGIEGLGESVTDGFEVTNAHETDTTGATVTKVWDDADDQDGIRPDSVTVQLLADGVATGDPVELTAEGGWMAAVTGLPLKKAGRAIVYTWAEVEVPEGYELSGSETEGTLTTLTNSHVPEKTEVSITKVWDDESDKDGIRPSSVEFQLMKSVGGEDAVVASDEPISLSGAGDEWTIEICDLPAHEGGQPVSYSVVELDVPDGYAAAVSDDGLAITNIHEPEQPHVPAPEEPDKPEKPDKPERPDKPEQPEKPDKPDKPDQPTDDDDDKTPPKLPPTPGNTKKPAPKTPAKASGMKLPQTGDPTTVVATSVLAGTGVAFVATGLRRRRRH